MTRASRPALGLLELRVAARSRRDALLPDLRRRLVARVAAAAGTDLRAEARSGEFPDPARRRHPRDQLRPQASVALEGRAARGCGAPGSGRDVRDLRRARRRRRRDRVRARPCPIRRRRPTRCASSRSIATRISPSSRPSWATPGGRRRSPAIRSLRATAST